MSESAERRKFRRDMVWNLAGFAVLGVSGILLNVTIGRFYDARALGVFNQAFACYIFFSQFAVFGLQFSVLKHVSEFAGDRAKTDTIVSAALIAGTALIAVVVGIAFLLKPAIEWLLDSEAAAGAYLLVLPGIGFFALNKILINVLNGVRAMRAFAILQACRVLFMLVALVICIAASVAGDRLALIITAAESTLFVILFAYSLRHFTPRLTPATATWIRTHLGFGLRGFLSGGLSEMNSRVDVLMLGIFLSDAIVGLYSMAAMLAEGIAQIGIVVRNNLNPLIARHVAAGTLAELDALIRHLLRRFYGFLFAVGLLATALYPYLLEFLVGNESFAASWPLFAILVTGIVIAGGYFPLEMLLVQAGHPGRQTALKAMVLGTNIALNALLIPYFGALGAACATAGSFVLAALYLRSFARRHIGIGR